MEFCRLERSAASKIDTRLAYRVDYCSSRSKTTKWCCCCCRCQYRDCRRNIGSRSPASCPWQPADNSRDALATTINSIEFTRNYHRINWRFWFTVAIPYVKTKCLTKDFIERFVPSFDLILYFILLFFYPSPVWSHPRFMLLLKWLHHNHT